MSAPTPAGRRVGLLTVVQIGDNPTKLRQAKKSVVVRKAVLAEKALRDNAVPT